MLNRGYSIIANKDDLDKENARIKQMLKENGYKENIIGKVFKRITNNDSLPQSLQLTQATDIKENQTSECAYIYCTLKVLVKNEGLYSYLIKKPNFLPWKHFA